MPINLYLYCINYANSSQNDPHRWGLFWEETPNSSQNEPHRWGLKWEEIQNSSQNEPHTFGLLVKMKTSTNKQGCWWRKNTKQ